MNSLQQRLFKLCLADKLSVLQRDTSADYQKQLAETVSQGSSAMLHSLQLHQRKFIIVGLPNAVVSSFIENLSEHQPGTESELERLLVQILEIVRPHIDGACNSWIQQSVGIMKAHFDWDSSSEAAARLEIERARIAANANTKRAAEKALLKRLVQQTTPKVVPAAVTPATPVFTDTQNSAGKAQSTHEIDNESKDQILVGRIISLIGESGQIYRNCASSDHGIDGEIEFKDDEGNASGKRLYVQLKSGDSHLTKRKRDGKDIFQIKNSRWASYWQQQAYTVMLVIRSSNGEIRWMDVSAYLKRESAGGKSVTQIVFEAEQCDVSSVRRWREKILEGR